MATCGLEMHDGPDRLWRIIDLLLIVADVKLIVASVRDAKTGKSLGEITLTGKPVMVQWAIGRYVDAWTNELTQYFDTYHM